MHAALQSRIKLAQNAEKLRNHIDNRIRALTLTHIDIKNKCTALCQCTDHAHYAWPKPSNVQ